MLRLCYLFLSTPTIAQNPFANLSLHFTLIDKKMPSQTGKVVLYLHLQKTGGNTVRFILERQFPKNQVYRVYKGLRKTELTPKKELQSFRLVIGHFKFGFHCFFSEPFVYMTMLREPVERVISNYFWTLQNKGHAYHQRVVSETSNIADYIISGIDPIVNNGMTKMLAGKGAPYGQVPVEYLDIAKANIEQFFVVVGLTKRFDETLLLIQNVFGWRNLFYVHRNVTKEKPPRWIISEHEVDVIREYNQLDIALYDYIQNRFEQTIAAQGEKFESRLKRFQLLNRWYGRAYRPAHAILDFLRKIRGMHPS